MVVICFFVQNIVADMRKVLAKNPQVEQQKLHRRVFLENIDPENQALLVVHFCELFLVYTFALPAFDFTSFTHLLTDDLLL